MSRRLRWVGGAGWGGGEGVVGQVRVGGWLGGAG